MPIQPLVMFTVYVNPDDFPGKFVARRWVATNPPVADEKPLCVCDSLAEVRARIPAGMTPIQRSPQDDPVILETWL